MRPRVLLWVLGGVKLPAVGAHLSDVTSHASFRDVARLVVVKFLENRGAKLSDAGFPGRLKRKVDLGLRRLNSSVMRDFAEVGVLQDLVN